MKFRRPLLDPAVRRECALVAIIFTIASVWGMVYVSTWGRTADILQASYGPAVMLACGRGFVNPKVSELPQLAAFLQPDVTREGPPLIDVFDCGSLPENVPTVAISGIHKQTWHMFIVVGWIWRLLGVSWSTLTPFYGLLYGASAVAAYGLFRLLMRPPVAFFCATLFLISPIQLHYLVRLRDYAKAPLLLAALFLLLLLLIKPRGPGRALWTSALAGLAIGTATGFRPEAMMYLLVFVPAVLLFYPGSGWQGWGIRGAAIGAFVICAFLAAAPALLRVSTHGERAHPFLMGYGAFFDGRLGAGSDVYQVAHSDLDTEAVAIINAHNQYLDSAAKPVIYEVPGYDVAGDDYFFRNILGVFTGDLATRTAAAALRTVDELRPAPDSWMPRQLSNQFLDRLYRARAWLMDTLFSRSRYVALALLLILGALSPRLGLLALYLAFCLAGMASVQFAARHYFHLEVIPLFLGGALLHFAWRGCLLVRRADRDVFRAWCGGWAAWRGRLTRGIAFALASAVLVLVPLWGLRWHQDGQMRALFTAYETAEREPVWPTIAQIDDGNVLLDCAPVTLPEGLPVAGPEGFFQVDMVAIEIAPGETGVPLRFRYTGDTSERDLSWHTTVRAPGDGPTTLYVPLYNAVWPDTPDLAAWGDLPPRWSRFDCIEVATSDLARITGMSRFRYAAGYTPLITAVLQPGWETTRLYQTFTR